MHLFETQTIISKFAINQDNTRAHVVRGGGGGGKDNQNGEVIE